MRWRYAATLLCAVHLIPVATEARTLRLGRSQHSSSAGTLRRRLNVNSLITTPGTFEWEWYGDFTPEGDFLIPTTWKITPGRETGFWARTEISTSFDAVNSNNSPNGRATQSSDHLTFAATTLLPHLGAMNFAIAPTTTFWLRGDSGARLGASFIGKVDGDRHQGGFSLSWSGATHASPTNPAGTLDAGAGYGYRLGKQGIAAKLTAHGNAVWERSTGIASLYNLSEGVEYQVVEALSFDLSGQHRNINNGGVDHQIVFGLTWNLGRIRRR